MNSPVIYFATSTDSFVAIFLQYVGRVRDVPSDLTCLVLLSFVQQGAKFGSVLLRDL